MSEAGLLRIRPMMWYYPIMEKNVNASRLFAPDFLRVPVRHAGAAAQGVAACLAAVALLVFCLYARRRWIAISKEGGKV
jgi:hypothetical protein